MTEQNKDEAKCECDVIEGRSTRLSFFLFFLYYAYPIILNDRLSNVFIFLCCTFYCVNSNINEFSILTKIPIKLNLHFFLLCCRLNVSLNELYPDKMNTNKDYNFWITFFSLSVTLFSVGSNMLLTFFCQ